MNEQTSEPNTRSGRWQFWLVWLAGVGPVMLAVVLYFNGSISGAQANYGRLVSSSESLQLKPLLVATGRWQLILSKSAQCEAGCQQRTSELSRLVRSLGKHADRVILVTIEDANSVGSVWIVDPLGNLVLSFDSQQAAREVAADLRKLLRISRIG